MSLVGYNRTRLIFRASGIVLCWWCFSGTLVLWGNDAWLVHAEFMKQLV
jgi:hypothetical protein